jgi:hypothetical protein
MRLLLAILSLHLFRPAVLQALFNDSASRGYSSQYYGVQPFDYFSKSRSIAAFFQLSAQPSSSFFKIETVYSEERQMSCYQIQLYYNFTSPYSLPRESSSFVGYDPTNNTLILNNQSISLSGLSAVSKTQSNGVVIGGNPFKTVIDTIGLPVMNQARLVKLTTLGTGNNATLINQTVVYGGSTIGIFDAFGNLRLWYQGTVFLGNRNRVYLSELFNNTFYIGVYDADNARLILSTVSHHTSSFEQAIFDFSSLPPTLFLAGQAVSLTLNIDPLTGLLYAIVIFKTSPVIKLRFNFATK